TPLTEALFNPSSLAIVGASDDPTKYGAWLAARALRGTIPVHLVNAARSTVLGHPTVPTVSAVGGQVDLAVIAVRADRFEEAVDDALVSGVRALVGITAGLGELGGGRLAHQAEVVERIRRSGGRLLGPNCLGVLDHSTGLDASVNDFPHGSIALISQSGNVAIDVGIRLAEAGLGLSRFASLGNQADIGLVELIDSCVDHDQTQAIAVYCEGFIDGRAFVRSAIRAAQAGKPVVLLTVGRSAGSRRAAASHTGALTSPEAVVQAACQAAGAQLAASPAQMVDLLQGLLRIRPPAGRRVAVISDGGGHGALASDALAARGFEVVPFGTELRAQVAGMLPPHATSANPIDLAGAGERDLDVFARLSDLLGRSPEVDAVVLTGALGGYHVYGPELGAHEVHVAREIVAIVAGSGSSYAAHLIFPQSPAAQVLQAGGIAVFRDVDAAAWVLDRLTRPDASCPDDLSEARLPQAPVSGGDYWSARTFLESAGIPFPKAARVTTAAELARASEQLDPPWALKALLDSHKSDRGGVVLGLAGPEPLQAAWQRLRATLGPPSFSIEQMADTEHAVELIVGVRRDSTFDVVVLVGLGGLQTEVLRDTALALGPVDVPTAMRMIEGLRGAAILGGFRGRPAVDVAAAARIVSTLSWLLAAHPEIREIECNPVLVLPEGAIAVDARMALA
ncbi:MAG: acetate--CoA ligase family protein, partial [Micrococcales bacterium]|nr:acetate--CoA ligase family protein [Micrococcales bacterium]